MLVVSCNAWLDVTPENAIADDDLFSTGFGYRNALNGIYTNLASDELYGKQLSWGFLSAISQQYNQKAGTISPMYADASELIYNTVDTEPVVTAIWEKGYKVIANLNKLIENIRSTDISLFEYGEEEKNLIYAEALSLRAMMHFDLLRLFAPATATNPSGSYLPYRDKYEAAVVEKCTVTDFIEKVLVHLPPVQLDGQDDVFPRVQHRHQIVALEDKANLPPAENGQRFIFQGKDVLPVHDHAAGGGPVKAAQHVQQGGFSGAGCPDHGYKLTFLHGKGHTVQGTGDIRLCAVVFFQITCL